MRRVGVEMMSVADQRRAGRKEEVEVGQRQAKAAAQQWWGGAIVVVCLQDGRRSSVNKPLHRDCTVVAQWKPVKTLYLSNATSVFRAHQQVKCTFLS